MNSRLRTFWTTQEYESIDSIAAYYLFRSGISDNARGKPL